MIFEEDYYEDEVDHYLTEAFEDFKKKVIVEEVIDTSPVNTPYIHVLAELQENEIYVIGKDIYFPNNIHIQTETAERIATCGNLRKRGNRYVLYTESLLLLCRALMMLNMCNYIVPRVQSDGNNIPRIVR